MRKIHFCVLPLAIALAACSSGINEVGPPEKIRVESTPERLARGEYLANHVTLCTDCHSKRNPEIFALPVVPGTEGMGGEHHGKEMGLPGDVYVDNITPAALGDWTDGELIRDITCGVSKNDKPLFPFMPYLAYGKLTREDLYSIVAYIRTLKPIENNVPETKIKFPVSMFMKSMPQPADYTPSVDKNNAVEYGKYLTTIASCKDCHTPFKKGKYIEEEAFSGGQEFPLRGGAVVRSANITPRS